MKVCLVNKFHYRRGGSETYYFSVAEALKAHGHEVIFFAMKDDKNMQCEQEGYFVSNASVSGGIRSKMNMVFHIAYSKEAYVNMKRLLVTESPDLLILNLIHKQITLAILDAVRDYRMQSGKNVVVFWIMHDLIAVCPAYTMLDGKGDICEECLSGSFAPCVKKRCIRRSLLMSLLARYEADYIKKREWYDEVDLFICPSEFYHRKLDGRDRTDGRSFTRSSIVMMRNPLPIDMEYELNDSDDGYFLYFGRLAREKGIKTLVDVAKRTSVQLVVLGTGEMERELREQARESGNVRFMGYQTGDNLKGYIRRCRCVILPSEWYENGPYSAMESMALGKPLIVSDMGGLPELVEDNVNGYVYSGGARGLEQCIKRMDALSAEEYRRMAQASLDRAKTLFHPDYYVEEIERHYGTFLKRKGAV